MNLSKKVTMMVLEKLINDFNNTKSNKFKLKIEAEIKCFQHHLKKFSSRDV